ncbi:hypothetical protein DFH09DRAFT_1089053 [Mycena vulgaris]|nr:hypothetical protein DFH09DRAFT_1089053 [Mycena vulgaris]
MPSPETIVQMMGTARAKRKSARDFGSWVTKLLSLSSCQLVPGHKRRAKSWIPDRPEVLRTILIGHQPTVPLGSSACTGLERVHSARARVLGSSGGTRLERGALRSSGRTHIERRDSMEPLEQDIMSLERLDLLEQARSKMLVSTTVDRSWLSW